MIRRVAATRGPVAFKYPYGVFNNNLSTGFVGTTLAIDATFNVAIEL